MKKSMILAGVLCIGYANAQTTETYENRVGINTETPSATLNVKSKTGTDNSTKNLELENSNGSKLLRVYDGGNISVGNGSFPLFDRVTREVTGFVSARANWLENSNHEGPYQAFINSSKTGVGATWVIYNNNISLGGGLAINAHDENFRNSIGVMRLKDDGKVGFGTTFPSEKIDIDGNARLRTLPNVAGASTDKVVVVDNTGVLKSVERSTITPTPTATDPKATTTDKICDENNAGTFYYKEKTVDGKKRGVMGFCTKQDDVFTWVYFSNGAGILQSAGSNQFDTL